MAAKIISSSIAEVARALLLTCVFILAAAAYGQESIPPGCVIRHHENGKPYIFCQSKDKHKDEKRTVQPQGAPSPPPQSSPVQARPDQQIMAPAPPRPPSQEKTEGRPTTPPSTHSSTPRPSAAKLRAVRALIEPAEMPPREVAGYGIVAFTTRLLPHDVERYKHICEAYKATLTSQAELPPNEPLSEQMITYWPITNKNTPEARRGAARI